MHPTKATKKNTGQVGDEVNRLFPVFLKMEELRLLVVGAGNVGLEKLVAVLQNSPSTEITIVAKEISNEVREYVQACPKVELKQKEFEPGDLIQKDIVIIAVNDIETSDEIRQAAKAVRLLVNVADKPELCDFYLGSIVQKGNVKIAISTNGKSPTLARRLKEVLNEFLPEEIHQLANNLNSIRSQFTGRFKEKVRLMEEVTRDLISGK